MNVRLVGSAKSLYHIQPIYIIAKYSESERSQLVRDPRDANFDKLINFAFVFTRNQLISIRNLLINQSVKQSINSLNLIILKRECFIIYIKSDVTGLITRKLILPFPSLSNACHAGYSLCISSSPYLLDRNVCFKFISPKQKCKVYIYFVSNHVIHKFKPCLVHLQPST